MREKLAALPGVQNCEVDYATKTANCQVEDPETFDNDAALAALADIGYKESKLKN